MDFRRHLARIALERVDRFVVHSIEEIAACSRWLDFPEERFRFVPLQRPVWPITQMEDERQPFLSFTGFGKERLSTSLFGRGGTWISHDRRRCEVRSRKSADSTER
jgi:hypothetical protein